MEMEMRKNMGNLSNVIEVDREAIFAQNESENENDNTGVGRTFECNYCKRGFTNAQALGGHMNIHRKDKARAKQQQQQQQQQQQKQSNFFAPTSIAYGNNEFYKSYYPNYANKKLLEAPFSPIYRGTNDFSRGRTRIFGMYEEHLGADLSLRVSSSSMVDQFRQSEEKKKDESSGGVIDLELRLGYGP